MKGRGIEETLEALQRAMDVTLARSKLIASNVAHAETPEYKAMDLDFSQVLGVVQGQVEATLVRTNPRHMAEEYPQPALPIRYRMHSVGEPRADGNTVELEEELAKLSGNQIRFQALAQTLNRLFANLKEVITEGGRR